MKKMVLGLSLALATFGLLPSTAFAETSPFQAAPALSAADQAFVASLAVPVEPTPAAKRPELGTKALCTATATCWDGSTVGCQGNNSTTSCTATDSNCPGTRGSVTCDGVTTACPVCPSNCGFTCAEERAFCVEICSPCLALFSCNQSTCTFSCRCKFSGCPV